MLEKRRMKRRHPIYYLKVFSQENTRMLGRLVDIHTEGMRIVSEKPIRPGTAMNLRLDLPDAVAGQKSLEFMAESVWCELDKNPDFYDTGIRFTKINGPDRQTITTVFDEYSFSY